MIHFPAFLGSQGKDQYNFLLPYYRGKGFFKVYSISLGEAFCHKPCLVSFNAPINIVFGLIDPFSP